MFVLYPIENRCRFVPNRGWRAKFIERAARTGRLYIETGNHTRRDRRMDEESRYLWLVAFLDGIAGENGSCRG